MIAAAVGKAIKDAGRNTFNIANAIGMNDRTLARRIKGDSAFDIDELDAIARELGITMSDLVLAAERMDDAA